MSYIVETYRCPEHDRFEELVHKPSPDSIPCPACGAESSWTISGPMGRVKLVAATQGKVEKAERDTWMNTESLGEGQSHNEWKKQRRAMWDQKRRDKIKKATA